MFKKKGAPGEWRRLTTCESEVLGLSKNWQIKILSSVLIMGDDDVCPPYISFRKTYLDGRPDVTLDHEVCSQYSKLLNAFWNKPRVRPRSIACSR